MGVGGVDLVGDCWGGIGVDILPKFHVVGEW